VAAICKMDVGELLSFKPAVAAKRDLEARSSSEEMPRKMPRQKISSGHSRLQERSMESDLDTFFGKARQKGSSNERHTKPSRHQPETVSERMSNVPGVRVAQENSDNNSETAEERQMKLLEMWEEKLQKTGDNVNIEEYDDQKVKKLILSFEKKVFKNQEMRIKFPDNPEKFMDSELDLNDVIVEMKSLATMPEQYHFLVELRSVSSMLTLLNHANTDIAIAVVDLLQELTDVDTLTENEEGAEVLIDALMEEQACALLVQNLERLDESVKEEANGVHNSLAVIENVLELKADLAPTLAQQGLLAWILKRIKAKMPFDANKLYCSEILSILLQDHDETRQQMGDMDGIDILLQQLAAFKKHDPNGSEEVEFMENLFNCLCSSLLFASNRDKFLNGEGLQLMNLMLREKKMSRNSALKVLDHAMSGPEGSSNCSRFVDILGLRTLFPLFMRPPKKNKKVGTSKKDYEEHVVSITASMLHNLKGSQRQRLIAKFSENDYAKVDRLLELHFKYYERVQKFDSRLDVEKARLQNQGDDVDDMDEEFYLRRLEAGLFTLQQTDYIIVDICASGSQQIKQRVLQILNLRGGSVKSIRNVIREYAGNMGDDNNSAETDQQRIMALADKF